MKGVEPVHQPPHSDLSPKLAEGKFLRDYL